MKNKKSKGLLLGVAMVASVASVGFASWVITSGASAEAQGNITAEGVTDNIIKLSKPTLSNETIHYGKHATETGPDWLKNADGTVSVLTTKVTFTVSGLQEGDSVVIGDIVEDGTALYGAAVTAGVVGELPKGETLTLTEGNLVGTKAEVSGTKDEGFTVTYDYTFTWGSKFENKSPEEFFKGKTVDGATEDPTYTTWGAYAVHYLEEVANIQGAKFKLTVTATPKQ